MLNACVRLKTSSLKLGLSALAVCSLLVANEAASAQPCESTALIQNGTFESPAITVNSTSQTTPANWTWNMSSIGFVFNGNVGPPWPLPPQGNQYADIGNSNAYALRQSFTLAERRRVDVSWKVATAGPVMVGYVMRLRDGSTDGTFFAYQDALVMPDAGWISRSTSSILDAGTYIIEFSPAAIVPSFDVLVDDVSVDASVTPGFRSATFPGALCQRSTAHYTSVAYGARPFQLRWQYRPNFAGPWIPLADGLVPGLGLVSGATAEDLTITQFARNVRFGIRPTITNSCGSFDGIEYLSYVCQADHNCDSGITVADIFDFLNDWFAGNADADINGLNDITVQDIFDFLNIWFDGCF